MKVTTILIAFMLPGSYFCRGQSGSEKISKVGTPFYASRILAFYKIGKHVQIETGLEYSYHKISISDYFDGKYYSDHYNINLVSIPISIRSTFFKYVYASWGLIVSYETNYSRKIDKQNGLGITTSLGAKYPFKSGITLFAGPTAGIYSLFSDNILDENLYFLGAELGVSIDL